MNGDAGAPRQPRAVEDDGFLRQPFQPSVALGSERDFEPRGGAGRPIDFLCRLTDHQNARLFLRANFEIVEVAPDYAARCVGKARR